MGRSPKPRKRRYKTYFEKETVDQYMPESTLRSHALSQRNKKLRVDEDLLSDHSTSTSDEAPPRDSFAQSPDHTVNTSPSSQASSLTKNTCSETSHIEEENSSSSLANADADAPGGDYSSSEPEQLNSEGNGHDIHIQASSSDNSSISDVAGFSSASEDELNITTSDNTANVNSDPSSNEGWGKTSSSEQVNEGADHATDIGGTPNDDLTNFQLSSVEVQFQMAASPMSDSSEDSDSDSDSSISFHDSRDGDISSSADEGITRTAKPHKSSSFLRSSHHERNSNHSRYADNFDSESSSTSQSSSSDEREHEVQQWNESESTDGSSNDNSTTLQNTAANTQLQRSNEEDNYVLQEERREGGTEPRKTNAFSRLKSSCDEVLNLNVSISLGEILTNILTLVKNHNLNHLLKENIMKFGNSILNSGSVLPCSRFLLDDFFYSKDDMYYHFYCTDCTEFLGSVPASNPRPSQIRCPNKPNCDRVNIISDLTQASYFVTFDIPSQLEILLGDAKIRDKLKNPVDVCNEPEVTVLRDIYDGKMYRKFAEAVKNDPSNNTAQVISFTLSVDSTALCSFSGQSACPAFLMVNELPPVLRMKHLLLAGLWFGKVKEKLDLFLPPIVKHLTKLSTCGFLLDLRLEHQLFMKAYLISCCADSVARCDVQGIHSHRGDYPCSWCLIEGEEYGATRIFRFSEACVPRTLRGLMQDANEALQTCTVVNGVKYLCPLAPAPLFHSIDGFIVDQMHAKDEGTTKSFLKAWLGEDGKTEYYIGSPSNLKILNAKVKLIKPPKEFRKTVRDFTDFGHWTGREFENFALFLSVPVLQNILSERYLKHWALYIQAIYILLLSEIPIQAIDIAENLLEEFCSKTETLYGPHMMRFNLHLARHFAENSRRWGNLFALSAYAFEAGNQRIKKLVHDCNFIPNQICRGFSETNALVLMRRICDTHNTRSFEEAINRMPTSTKSHLAGSNAKLLGFAKKYNPTEEELWFIGHMQMTASHLVQYDQIMMNGCVYEASLRTKRGKKDNSFARLLDSKFILIKRIIFDSHSDQVWIVGSRIRCAPSSYVPHTVNQFNPSLSFQFVVTSIDEDIEFFEVNQLDTVCVNMKLQQGHYISPMPNIVNMF